MDKLFKYIGGKAGHIYKKSKWVFDSVLGDENDAVKAEYQFGLYMTKDLQKNNKITRADLLVEIGDKLTKKIKSLHKFNFIKMYSDEVNAFALPGGFIFMNSAIINFCDEDKDQLAFILAHEMAHVIKGHAFNRLLAEYSINTISRLVKATGLLQTAAKELTRKFLITHYSRENEFEADEFGVRLMTAAGYQSKGASEFFKKLEKLNSDKANYPEYFSSHPNTKARLENIRKLL